MKKQLFVIIVCFYSLFGQAIAQRGKSSSQKVALEQAFLHPPESAKPWVFWYWMQGAVSRQGITADLQAMKQAGIAGAYLMPIKGPANPPFINPSINQLTPEWWAMVKFTMQEADRIDIKLAMHDSDGFALAGGPWITPQLSMQKVVWSKTMVEGGRVFKDTLPVPRHYKNYYKDIEILAYPSLPGEGLSSYDEHPKVTTGLPNTDVQDLAEKGNTKSFASAEPCWLQLEFARPFTCRSLIIHTSASNYQAERLLLEASDDGKNFRLISRLQSPRHGWQDGDAEITNAIKPTTARYFRMSYDKTGSEPGAEDLDFAKWKPTLKLSGIELLSEPRIHQYESKNGEVWRLSKRTTNTQMPVSLCVDKDKIINLTDKLDADGKLNWNAPPGKWTIIRMGHTSTGHTNATGGGGIGLECDKFNPEAAKIQFENWFGEAIKQGGEALAKRVLKIFHVDSWECGSQNWSPVFAGEFRRRRGYDLLPYLPVMAGVPMESADKSEKVLADVRQTIAELLVDNFYGTMAKLAHQKGCTFSAESVAPTMMSDGMLHYSKADMPMGEFWFRSPTHDKPNDMLDAISGGHVYGKNIIQAEAFTELRLLWDEHPGMLKTTADRNFALGINRYVFHVNVHNPWLDRKPGMTLDGIGLFFQRDQTWWVAGKAWFDYISRCQYLLQQGHQVTDIAVFTGEETPRRAILPDRLVNTLPGIFGAERVKQEAERLANKDVPIINSIEDASHSANMALPENWTDPLLGYAYDSFNKDALLRLTTVKNGRIVLPGGASYAMLVIPGESPMQPEPWRLSVEVTKKLQQLVNEGATVLLGDKRMEPLLSPSKANKLLIGPYQKNTFDELGISRDLVATDSTDQPANGIAWVHRKAGGIDIYFISNQQAKQRRINLSLRVSGRFAELWDPLTGVIKQLHSSSKLSRTSIAIDLAANGSAFIVLRSGKPSVQIPENKHAHFKTVQTFSDWPVQFDPQYGGPAKPQRFDTPDDWSRNSNDSIKYYSGTAIYDREFQFAGKPGGELYLDLGNVANMAQVYVNDINCGTAWTYPYRVNVSKAIKPGKNKLSIKVTNTWANRLMGDHVLPENKRITWTNAPYRLEDRPLLPAGLLSPVKLLTSTP